MLKRLIKKLISQIFNSIQPTPRGTLLYFAAYTRNARVIDQLIKKGAIVDVLASTPKSLSIDDEIVSINFTPLHAAIHAPVLNVYVCQKAADCIRLLLNAGADPELGSGSTPRELAEIAGFNRIIDEVEQERVVIVNGTLINKMPKELRTIICSYLTSNEDNKECEETKSLN